LEKQIYYHNNGRRSYTKNRGPWFLMYQETYETRNGAIRRERELKNRKSSTRIIKDLKIDTSICGGSGSIQAQQ